MKSLFYFSLFFLFLGLNSCKKEEPVLPDFSHFEGNFLCDVDDNYSHMGSNNKDYDQVIRCWIENDSLKVLNHAFPIVSEDQTVFQINFTTGGTGYIKVTFSSNFHCISVYRTWTSNLSGPSTNATYEGIKTSLPETKDPHPCLDELEGTYNLNVSYRNTIDLIDTQYVINVPVTLSNNTVEIDNDYFYFGTFHSYFDQTDYSGWNGSKDERFIQWHSDTLNIEYRQTADVSFFDTVEYIIYGTK